MSVTSRASGEVSQQRKAEALANARTILGAAGGTLSPEMEALLERHVAGELTMDQVRAEYLSRAL